MIDVVICGLAGVVLGYINEVRVWSLVRNLEVLEFCNFGVLICAGWFFVVEFSTCGLVCGFSL